MNTEQFKSTLRAVLAWVGSLLVAKGIGDAGMWEAVAGGIIAVAGWVWGMKVHADPKA